MILITGDVVLDHTVYAGQRSEPISAESTGMIYREVLGGAWLTCGILAALRDTAAASGAAPVVDEIVFGLDGDKEKLRHARPFNYGSVWKLFEETGKKPTWRMEMSLGYGASQDGDYPASPAPGSRERVPEVLVIDDGGLGFRNPQAKGCWPVWLSGEERPAGLEWIILKLSRPLARGELSLNLMRESWRKRLIVIVSADQLRSEGLRVEGGLSWETSVDDIVDELHGNRALHELVLSRHLVVTMRSDAALWLDQPGDEKAEQRQLVFDRKLCEGEFEQKHKEWKAYGYQSAAAAALAWFIAEALGKKRAGRDPSPAEDIDLTLALTVGLSGKRYLLEHGHGEAQDDPRFPYEGLAKHLLREQDAVVRRAGAATYAVAEARRATGEREESGAASRWTILGQVSPWHFSRQPKVVSLEPARRVAVRGPDALPGVPCATFGKLQTFDRHEIDSLRSLRQLMLLYRDNPSQKKPLCLGVFGSPGSGKSFGLKQIAKGVFGAESAILEFNLSQFRETDLFGAFHQVRDSVLGGATPVVFWDEFDSNNYDWLKYFLAPMQDGTFQEGQITHSVGRAVFVFAGGVNDTFQAFCAPSTEKKGDFLLKKGPDFISRLSAYLNIAGPNPRTAAPEGDGDVEYPVRRAMVIRIALGLGDRELQIERGLLTALLGARRYRNGARSLEKLVTYIRDSGGFPLRHAFLPPDQILALLVEDVGEFHRLIRRYGSFYAQADLLAPVIHEDWMSRLREEERRTNKNAVPWAELSADVRDSNVAAALRIPFILELAGLALEEGVGDSPDFDAAVETHMETMAAAEHGGWEEQRRMDGWTYSARRVDEALRHDLLRPYDSLTDEEKEKDRNTIRRYPEYARLAGFRIVRKAPDASLPA